MSQKNYNPKPKEKCLVDLRKMVNTWRQKHENSSIIIMMDANGDSPDKHLQEFIRETCFHDVVEHYSPSLVG